MSIARQCRLLGLVRGTYYYTPVGVSARDLTLMRLIDEQYTATPFYGSRRLVVRLRALGHEVNRKHVQRLMRVMGLEAIYPKPRLSAGPGHVVYPYLLRDVAIVRVNQVWSTDITYIRLRAGFVYLMAILDWFSRFVIGWALSTTLDGQFCREALEAALTTTRPEIFNTDQGPQFASPTFTDVLKTAGVQISMDGRGRALDNVFVERLWRTVKYEEVYLKDYGSVPAAEQALRRYFRFYNDERPHQALGYRTPASVYATA